MNRNRSIAAALLLPLAGLGVLAAGTAPTSAAGAHPAAAAAATTSRPYLIQGVVADMSGHYLDDVSVEAVKNGVVAASALTYASSREDGPQHGYYFLEVKQAGSYTVTFTRNGYESTTREAEVGRRHRTDSLGETDLKRKAAATSTTAGVKSRQITTDDKGRVTVTVSTTATRRPTGEVQVRIGRQVVGVDTLTSSDGGSVTVGLHRLTPGTYNLKAWYAGSRKQNLLPSVSSGVTLQVVRPRGHHRRPNAW